MAELCERRIQKKEEEERGEKRETGPRATPHKRLTTVAVLCLVIATPVLSLRFPVFLKLSSPDPPPPPPGVLLFMGFLLPGLAT